MKAFKTTRRYLLILFIVAMTVCLTQLQPWVTERMGGVDGSFGVRPVSHACLGFTYKNGFFPRGEADFTFQRFHFRYSVAEDVSRSLCIGQDIWYGE